MAKGTDLYELNTAYIAQQDHIIKQELKKIYEYDIIISRPEGVQ